MDFRMQLFCVFLLLVPAQVTATPGYSDWPEVSGPYLGQKSPGMVPERFAPRLISTGQDEVGSVFTPDLDEFYFTTWTPETGTKIMVVEQFGGYWKPPRRASFSNHATDVDAAISPDGKRLFFGTKRPRTGETGESRSGFDIWVADLTETGWGEEYSLGTPVNSGQSQVYPTVAENGTLYFQAIRDEGYGKADIYRSRLSGGKYQEPENLGPVVNSEHYEGDVYIDPDESYLIVSIHGREDELGGGDLYISFRRPDYSWSPPKNMGPGINSDKREFCPMVSPDGKYLFFTSKRRGPGDIYWVDARVIETFRD